MRTLLSILSLTLAAVLLVCFSNDALAQHGRTPGYDLEFAQFLRTQGERLTPCVVAIETRFTRFIFEEGREREIMVAGDFSTGFVYNDEGIIVTDYKSIEHPPSTYFARTSGFGNTLADYILVRFDDGRQYEAEVVGLDGPTSLAVLRILHVDPGELTPIPFGTSGDVIVGEPVLFLGYDVYTRTRINYHFGVVSALRPKFPSLDDSVNQYFQVNMPQHPGNQGGIVVNSQGGVIAVMTNTKPYPDATEIHFALPMDQIREIVDSILDTGEVRRPWIGFRLLEMNPQIERAYSILDDLSGDGLVTNVDRDIFQADTGIDLRECLFIIYVDEDSPGADIGLLEADILMEFNGTPVHDMTELRNELDRYRIGDVVTLEWLRREYAVWDPYIGEMTIEYDGQRDEEED